MPKTYVLLDDDDQVLDSHVSFQQGALILHSRGGTKGKNVRNADYSIGLRLLLGRLKSARLDIRAVWLDSNTVQSMPLPDRELLSESEGHLEVQDIQRLLTSRMKTVRSDRSSTANGGNSTRRILIQTAFDGPARAFAAIMKCVATDVDTGSYERLPVEQLNNVTAEHVWLALEKFVAGNVVHAFGPSTDYDLIADDGSRHPPKAVFGVALAIALPSVTVLPRHFAGGEGSTCFRLLRAAGFEVFRKDSATVPEPLEVMSWREGERILKAHRVRERGRGLAKAKKAEFLRNHGRLFCQRCGDEPTTRFGTPHAEACIEVHHSAVLVSEMGSDHRTTLADLDCLCANCHRLVHRLIQRGEIE